VPQEAVAVLVALVVVLDSLVVLVVVLQVEFLVRLELEEQVIHHL
jgi:hypothetical protein